MAELIRDLATAAVDRLVADPEWQALVISGVIGTDAADSDPDADKLARAWLFQGLNDDGTPYRDPVGTGKATVVLIERTQWTTNPHNTAKFPVLQALIYADASRNDDGSASDRDQDRRCKTVAKTVDDLFHDPANRKHDWPGLFVVSCVRSQGLSIMDVPGTGSLCVRGELRYETTTDS